MSKYKIHRVYVSAGTTETLTVDYEHTTNELYFWAFPDTAEGQEKHIEEGCIESWMNAGKCICIGDGQYRFFGAFTCGYTVFVARKSDADTIPEQKPYGAFPLASLIQSIGELIKRVEEDATEILRALRAPEADGKMILPMKNRRAGKILGFNDAGFPTVGEDCKQISELFDAQKNCASYVEQAALEAQESANHADYAQRYAREAGDSATESDKHADDAHRYAQEALGSLQKIGDQAHKAIEEINRVAGEVSSGIDGELRDVESNVSEDAAITKELVQRTEEIYQSLSALKENYSGLQCFISCAAKHVENNRMFVENLLAENAEGLNAINHATETNSGTVFLAEGTSDERVNAVLTAQQVRENFTSKEQMQEVSEKISEHGELITNAVPLLETVPADGNNNADAHGYLGTLRALGAFGGAVLVRRLSVWTRATGTIASGSIAVWARILKIENGAWTVAAQSEDSAKWNDYGLNAEIEFKMLPVVGVTPPNADETIAVVFVNDPAATAATSHGKLSFRTITLHGGIANVLNAPDNLNAGNSWSPRIKLRFAPLAGTQICATQENLETLANATGQALASVEQWLNALETDVSLKADSDALTALADRVAALEAASAGTEE
ncbi:MAG: hypothetical protein E7037_04810 [Verrucomicrobia bacterium]|nr:hypothetical protein [Verrucomicrobiota bacterium]